MKRKQLQQAKKEALVPRVNFPVLELRSEVNDLPNKENRMWFQRSWSLWTVHGDKNSKYFHKQHGDSRKIRLMVLEIL